MSSKGEKLDSLALEILDKMNEIIRIKVDLESQLLEGQNFLAKTRYLCGNSSTLGLIDEGNQISSTTVEFDKNENSVKLFFADENRKGKQLKLPPQTLKFAREKFLRCLEISCDLLNTKFLLKSLCEEYKTLRMRKNVVNKNNPLTEE